LMRLRLERLIKAGAAERGARGSHVDYALAAGDPALIVLPLFDKHSVSN